ncbi:MAG: hypothetical protein GTO63_00765 [Anaerolineae bacterium]|nr:hypothetical protein [Anaerolineae bacterium]NIN93541.1 hypothetical protein [Anaerolineae bacterium]NIQ76610.1 hypothetical protein [Anaerolineae bacterium]
MTRHVTDWLGAYLDGELGGLRVPRVEAHVAECARCQAELDGLRALTVLLQESPPAEAIMPAERFVANVGLRLRDRPGQSAPQRAMEMGWRLVPVGLLGALAFVQSTFIVTWVVRVALWMGWGGSFAARWLPVSRGEWLVSELLSLPGASLAEAAGVILRFLGNGGPLGWSSTLYLVLLVLIGLLYWSWLASWWVRRQPHRLGVRDEAG